MDGLADLPPLREVIAAHGLDARKRLGQHFLLDLNLTRRIARAEVRGRRSHGERTDPRARQLCAEAGLVVDQRLPARDAIRS